MTLPAPPASDAWRDTRFPTDQERFRAMSESALQPFHRAVHGARNAGGLPGSALPWLTNLRGAGWPGSTDGLPDPRVEKWKYTNLRALERQVFRPRPR